jgi:hypothetical protein
MENRTALWQQIPKRKERTFSEIERRHHGACGPSAFTVKHGGKRPVRYRASILVNGRSFRRRGRGPKGRFLVEYSPAGLGAKIAKADACSSSWL